MNGEPVGRLVLRPREDRALRRGRLWIYADEVAALELDAPGGLVHVFSAQGRCLGTAYAHPDTTIAARLLSGKALVALRPAWWRERLEAAMRLRARVVGGRHWRWAHGEGDRLPGLVVDRYGDALVVQPHTAGIERRLDAVLDALERLARPSAVYVQARAEARRLEGLPRYAGCVRGEGSGEIEAEEGGLVLRAHALTGQKTGFFYDQRDNRLWLRGVAAGARVLDAFCYVGGFGLQALAGGAASALFLDVSESALALARANAERAGFGARAAFRRADAMQALEALAAEGERFDIVVCDPPAFARSRAQAPRALRGYERLARLAARLVATGGILCLASCSGVVPAEDFRKACLRGIRAAGRAASVLRQASQAPDHPWPMAMPELQYLKFFAFALHG